MVQLKNFDNKFVFIFLVLVVILLILYVGANSHYFSFEKNEAYGDDKTLSYKRIFAKKFSTNFLRPTPKRHVTTRKTTQFFRNTPSPLKCDDFVVFSNSMKDGRGLGNQISTMVAGLMVAELTGRYLAMNSSILNETDLESIFTHRYKRTSMICDLYPFSDIMNLAYNPLVEQFSKATKSKLYEKTNKILGKTIVLGGFFQSWKYAIDEYNIKKKYLKINDKYKNFSKNFFKASLPDYWVPHTFTRVGVHVRRGDVLTPHSIKFGYTTPQASYFHKAMKHIVSIFKKVQFFIVSNDIKWCKQNLNITDQFNKTQVNITFSEGNDFLKDFSILAFCHHTIMSTGTFGWWAGYITKGVVIYYKSWPKPNSSLEKNFKQDDFFPPSWIGFSD